MSIIERKELESLIPHKGTMCLLDSVKNWDDKKIHCTSISHAQKKNPLVKNSRLSSIHAIEYGAQAMAVHGALIARSKGKVLKPGYLAALRNIDIKRNTIDDIIGELDIFANCLFSDGGNLVYLFEVKCDNTVFVSGRATIIQMERV